MNYYEILLYISIFSNLVPITTYCYFFSNANSKIGLAFLLLLLLNFIIEGLSQILILSGMNNIALTNLYLFISPFLVFQFYWRNFFKKNSPKFLIFFFIIFLISAAFFLLTLGIINRFINELLLIENTSIALISLYLIAKYDKKKNNLNLAMINFAFLLNSSLTFFVFAFSEFFIEWNINLSLVKMIWSIVLISTILFNMFSTFGIWKTKF